MDAVHARALIACSGDERIWSIGYGNPALLGANAGPPTDHTSDEPPPSSTPTLVLSYETNYRLLPRLPHRLALKTRPRQSKAG